VAAGYDVIAVRRECDLPQFEEFVLELVDPNAGRRVPQHQHRVQRARRDYRRVRIERDRHESDGDLVERFVQRQFVRLAVVNPSLHRVVHGSGYYAIGRRSQQFAVAAIVLAVCCCCCVVVVVAAVSFPRAHHAPVARIDAIVVRVDVLVHRSTESSV